MRIAFINKNIEVVYAHGISLYTFQALLVFDIFHYRSIKNKHTLFWEKCQHKHTLSLLDWILFIQSVSIIFPQEHHFAVLESRPKLSSVSVAE